MAELVAPEVCTKVDLGSDSGGSQRDALEVVFEDEQAAIHRRKSSIVSRVHLPRPAQSASTNCFVHQLLDGHRKGGIAPHSEIQESIPVDKVSDRPKGDIDAAHSRHLTKKQLSDVAFGIRELSKKLAHIKLKLRVQNIFVLSKVNDDAVVGYTRELAEWLLLKDTHHRVYVEDTFEQNEHFRAKQLLDKHPTFRKRLRFWDNELCAKAPQTFDIVITLGGDGTVLYASWLFQRIVPPILSFALGSLGFLTKFDFDGYPETLSRVFADGFNATLRVRFEATVMRQKDARGSKGYRDIVEELIGTEAEDDYTHEADGYHHILNEIVLDRGPSGNMVTLEVFGDNEHFTTVQADGICVATPTGSTAYNLAAGGSLCHPDNPVMLLNAICAHTLSFRPIILPDTIVLRIGIPYDARNNAWASFDGRERVELFAGDYVTISASRFPFPSVLPLHRNTEDWIDSISRTLNWNSRQRQKMWNAPKKKGEVAA